VTPLPAPGEPVRLSAEEASHARARRLSRGNPVVLFDGEGREARGRVTGLTRTAVEVVADEPARAPEGEPPLALYVAAVRLERLAWTVEKAAELGAARLVVIRAERSQGFRAPAAAVERLRRVARAAAKQSGNPRALAVEGPFGVREAFFGEASPSRLLLDFDGAPFPETLAPAGAALAIGPEGGWSDAERRAAEESGWTVVRLPAGLLRAETAAIAGLVLARAALARGTSFRAT